DDLVQIKIRNHPVGLGIDRWVGRRVPKDELLGETSDAVKEAGAELLLIWVYYSAQISFGGTTQTSFYRLIPARLHHLPSQFDCVKTLWTGSKSRKIDGIAVNAS